MHAAFHRPVVAAAHVPFPAANPTRNGGAEDEHGSRQRGDSQRHRTSVGGAHRRGDQDPQRAGHLSRCAAQEHGQRHRGRRGGDEGDRLARCLVGRPAAENQRGATWTNTATMRQPRYRPKVMVASRVSQRGQVMSSPWRSSSRMMLINAAPSREHCDAGPQPVSGGDHQPGAEAENTSDASTSARFPAPRRARTGPSPRRSPRRAHRAVPRC